jgi:hypothetical protein
MSHKTRRAVIVLATLVSLALPLAAQARPDRQDRQERQLTRTERLIAGLWEHFKASFAVLLDGELPPPPPPANPGETTDGRSILDPIG